ncbi:MAG: hypothetical protein L0Z62_39880 [Gemmataceae bacterium]|nr:hypothetical protein [Gemmataceae bacterium]
MNGPEDPFPIQRVRVMQIIAGMLIVGVLFFLGLVLYLVHVEGQGQRAQAGLPLVTMIAVGMFGVCALLAFALPAAMTNSALRRLADGTWQPPPNVKPQAFATTTQRLLLVRQTTLIVGMALLEGPAFLACTAYLLEVQPPALVVVGAAVFLMVWSFPTTGRVRAWVEQTADALEQQRHERELTRP